jgi:hypothetical protein
LAWLSVDINRFLPTRDIRRKAMPLHAAGRADSTANIYDRRNAPAHSEASMTDVEELHALVRPGSCL